MRVVVIGTSCSGKTTFAKSLADAKHITHIELDEHHWGPNWTPVPQPIFLQSVSKAVEGEHWVASGNYDAVRDVLWSRATTIVWLNYSFPVVLWRGTRRTIRRAVTREELFHGNRESFKLSFFSRDSILWWIVTTFHRRRREFKTLRASIEFQNLDWREARRPRQAELILEALIRDESSSK
jgi:adenylate kinase family enzyme